VKRFLDYKHLNVLYGSLLPVYPQWATFESRASTDLERWATARVFYRAAIEGLMSYNGQEWQRLGSDSKLVRGLMDWGLAEIRAGCKTSGRRLLRAAVDEASRHPDGVLGGGGIQALHRWASEERKNGNKNQVRGPATLTYAHRHKSSDGARASLVNPNDLTRVLYKRQFFKTSRARGMRTGTGCKYRCMQHRQHQYCVT
jgi:hypothetical protein